MADSLLRSWRGRGHGPCLDNAASQLNLVLINPIWAVYWHADRALKAPRTPCCGSRIKNILRGPGIISDLHHWHPNYASCHHRMYYGLHFKLLRPAQLVFNTHLAHSRSKYIRLMLDHASFFKNVGAGVTTLGQEKRERLY